MTIVIVLELYIYKQLLKKKNQKHIGNYCEVQETLNALKASLKNFFIHTFYPAVSSFAYLIIYFDAFFQTTKICLLHLYSKRQKWYILTLPSISTKSLQVLQDAWTNKTVPERPVLKARDKIMLKWKSEVAWCIDKKKKKIVPRYFKFQAKKKPKKTSCMTILMEMRIKKTTSKAVRSQLLRDTTQVPEAHLEIAWQVMQCTELTYSIFPTGHETQQKVTAIPCTS